MRKDAVGERALVLLPGHGLRLRREGGGVRVAGVLRVTGGFAPGALCDVHQAEETVWLRECISGVGGVFEERK